MQACNRLKTAFAQGKQSMGMWQMIPGPNVSRLLARSGVDWVMVDCEHGNIDGRQTRFQMSARCGFADGSQMGPCTMRCRRLRRWA